METNQVCTCHDLMSEWDTSRGSFPTPSDVDPDSDMLEGDLEFDDDHGSVGERSREETAGESFCDP